jgi:hypothetical protein
LSKKLNAVLSCKNWEHSYLQLPAFSTKLSDPRVGPLGGGEALKTIFPDHLDCFQDNKKKKTFCFFFSGCKK